jgi:putative transferase (TIGR04331 family)
LEGYRDLVTLTTNLPWPKRPKAIFTSNSHISDDVFKVWAAEKSELCTPIIIGQHGGNYGMALWNFTEDHQIAIADRFLTWGWSEPEQYKVTPVGNFKDIGKKIVADKTGIALLVETTMPQNSYHMYSGPVAAGQWQEYFADQCRFVQALPLALRDQVLVRLFSQDHAHAQKQRWQTRFPGIQLETGVLPMISLMRKARVCISTYNSTTYLESMSLNFPTIMFWNPKHWELRDSAIPYFEQLKSVGIFHETPESAARQMVAVWDDVAAWWGSEAVQLVRREFCERYAHKPEKPLDVMEKLFREIAVTSYA